MKNKKTYLKSGLLVALLAGSGMAGVKPLEAETDSSSLAYLSRQVEGYMAKAGLSFGGEFRSRGLGTSMSGNAVELDKKAKKQREDVLFTSLDLEMKVGPHSALQGTAVLRLHEDWRNMFASNSTPLTVRWLSIDGNVKDVFFYNLGDFKQKFTELTLWAPEPEIMYEPYIFARQREQVMREVYAGDNNRVLQGANFAFMAQMKPAFDEFSVKAYATRLRKQGKDVSQLTPEQVDAEDVLLDRYSSGVDIFMEFRKDLELGVTGIYTGDAINTYIKNVELEAKDTSDKTIVLGANAAFGTGLFDAIDTSKINVRLDAEVAMSVYRTGAKDTLANKDVKIKYTNTNGMAINANLGTSVGLGDAGKLKLDLGYILNNEKFVNEMSQSPVFFSRQVLNTTVEKGFNSFDGLYKSVFKYTPGQNEFNTKEPMNKIAWTRGVLTKKELDMMEKRAGTPSPKNVTLDRTFSPIMHFGKGTANRAGIDAAFGGEFIDKAILFNSEFKLMNTPTAMLDTVIAKGDTTIVGYKTDFLQYAGGVSVDIAQLGNWWQYPFILSGSYRHTNSETKPTVGSGKAVADLDFMNGSLYWKFWKRAALMGGFQMIVDQAKLDGEVTSKITQMNVAGGLEYKVTEGGTLTGTVGNISKKYKAINTDTPETNDNFSTMQFDLFLTVVF